jgi:hypothetical protein
MIAEALLQLAATAWGVGDAERGKEIYEEGIILCRQAGYTFRLPDFLLSLGYQLLLEGDYGRGPPSTRRPSRSAGSAGTRGA